jgi:hypothetical protein
MAGQWFQVDNSMLLNSHVLGIRMQVYRKHKHDHEPIKSTEIPFQTLSALF